MNKSESKYANTASLMNQAFLLILDKKPYEYITVKEVCEKAGVNRSTFYLHYDSMDDLVCECFRSANGKMRQKFAVESRVDQKNLVSCSIKELDLVVPKYLSPYLEFIKENKKLFRIMVEHPKVFAMEERFFLPWNMKFLNQLWNAITSLSGRKNIGLLFIKQEYFQW